MIPTSIRAIVSAIALASAVPAAAIVTYSFNDPASGSFTYQTSTYITAQTSVPAASLSSCTTSFGTCGTQTFYPDASAFGAAGYTAIGFQTIFSIGTGTRFSYFAAGAFSTPGSYNELLVGRQSVLTVSGQPSVPEPATWALLVGGFALTGAAMRRQSAARA